MNSGAKRRLVLLLVAVACTALSSCGPASKEPLSDAIKSEPDNDLNGTWMREDDTATNLMIIGRRGGFSEPKDKIFPRSLMVVTGLHLPKDGELEESSADNSLMFFVSRIGQETYANLFETKVVRGARNKGEWIYPADVSFTLVKYRAEKNALDIYLLDEEKVKAAIKKSLIKGTVVPRKEREWSDKVVITDGKAAADYLAKEGGKALFQDKPDRWARAKVVPVK